MSIFQLSAHAMSRNLGFPAKADIEKETQRMSIYRVWSKILYGYEKDYMKERIRRIKDELHENRFHGFEKDYTEIDFTDFKRITRK